MSRHDDHSRNRGEAREEPVGCPQQGADVDTSVADDLDDEYPYAVENVRLGDSWRYEEKTRLWRCGEIAIDLYADDRTRYYVYVPASGDAEGRVLFGGRVPPSGYQ